jgi:hypothetical protein
MENKKSGQINIKLETQMQSERAMIKRMHEHLAALADKSSKYEHYSFSNIFAQELIEIS